MKTTETRTFKNLNYSKRSDCTNIVYCEATETPEGNWTEVDAVENTLNQLFLQGNVKYFGYL